MNLSRTRTSIKSYGYLTGLVILGVLGLFLVFAFHRLTWRENAFFLLLAAIPALSGRVAILQKYEAAAALLAAVGMVFLFTGQTGEPTEIIYAIPIYSLYAGALLTLLFLMVFRQRRPVGGIVDLLVVLFCVGYPVLVFIFQLYVANRFEEFPVHPDLLSPARQMLTVLAAYTVLTQFVLPFEEYRVQSRWFWRVLLVLLALNQGVMEAQTAAIGGWGVPPSRMDTGELKQLLQYTNRRGYPGREKSAGLELSGRLFKEGQYKEALKALDPILSRWPREEARKELIQDKPFPEGLKIMAAGVNSLLPEGQFVALEANAERGALYFLQKNGSVLEINPEGRNLYPAPQTRSQSSPFVDLKYSTQSGGLCLLDQSGHVYLLDKNEGSSVWKELPLQSVAPPARVLETLGSTGCLIVGQADFTLLPVDCRPPESLQLDRQPLRKGRDLLRGACFLSEGVGGYLLDAYGGIHPVGWTPIEYADLSEHSLEKFHYWPGRDMARAVVCNPEGNRITVIDAYGGIHCVEKSLDTGEMFYFGSTRASLSEPVVVDAVMLFDSIFIIRQGGRVDKKGELRKIYSLFTASGKMSGGGWFYLTALIGLGIILLISPRRIVHPTAKGGKG